MKKVFVLIGLFAVSLFAEAEPVAGQKTVQKNLVTWSAANGNWLLKTRLLFLGNAVYVDTSATGQANAFKRVDNAADSCSNPFNLGSDSNGVVRPIWLYQLWETVRGVDGDSTSHTFRVQTRERVWDGSTRTIRWTPWTRKGANTGFADVTILDSLLIGNVKSTAKTSAYAVGNYLGSQARLCPDDNVATGDAAGDSLFADSLFHFTR
mgnify:CR=1 FL=1